ncbi:MAG: FadR family transcriptional regulator [candidate division NC10 bacterium]|nr:FadR family transcriptional regulator [candidate division NC10 bacterium]
MLKAIKKTKVYKGIVLQLRNLIAEGKLKPGDQLPPERELSETFQVSRASVREAIRALESLGLVESRQGEGTYVVDNVQILLQRLAGDLLEEQDALLEIFEARKILEPEIAAFAAKRATPLEIQEMANILERQAQEIARGGTGVEEDTAFHSALARAAKNMLLLRLTDAIVDSLRKSRERSLQTGDRPVRSLAGHREILEAIKAQDTGWARRATLRHLEEIENILWSQPKED